MDIVIKISNVKNKYKEINEIIEKFKEIQDIKDIGGNINSNIIERNFEEKRNNCKNVELF